MAKKKKAPIPAKEDLSECQSEKLSKAEELLRKLLDERLDEDASFEDYEKEALKIGNEIVRRRLERKLQGMADVQPRKVRIDHNNDWHGHREQTAFNYAKHLLGTVTYHSLVGGLKISRHTYRECCRAGVTYVLLELQAGLLERMTPALAQAAALGFAEMPTRRLHQLLIACGRAPPSRSTLERCATDLGSYAAAANAGIEADIRAKEILPEGVKRIVLGLDRTAVPMRPGGAMRQVVSDDLRRSRPKGPVCDAQAAVEWHMDYVGTVGFVDKDGKRICSRQYRAPFCVDAGSIAQRMLADATTALSQRPKLATVVVQDGAPEMWKVMGKALSAAEQMSRWDEVLDFYHLDERLGKCLDLITSEPSKRVTRRRKWRQHLLESERGIERVLGSLKRLSRKMSAGQRAELSEHTRYMENQKARTRYAHLRQHGIPIGSGLTEGACKSLVGMRAKRSGQRWSQRGLTAALHLRSIIHSDRFDAFWPLFAQRYSATSVTPLMP